MLDSETVLDKITSKVGRAANVGNLMPNIGVLILRSSFNSPFLRLSSCHVAFTSYRTRINFSQPLNPSPPQFSYFSYARIALDQNMSFFRTVPSVPIYLYNRPWHQLRRLISYHDCDAFIVVVSTTMFHRCHHSAMTNS